MGLAETLHDMSKYDTSLRDWEKRIIKGDPLLPKNLPVFPYGKIAMRVFKMLRVNDVIGKPTIGECMPQWVFDWAGVLFNSYDRENRIRYITDYLLLISKKNAKSTVAAGIMMTETILSDRDDDLYMILAPTKEVAGNSFDPAKGMIENDPVLLDTYKPQDSTKSITHYLTGTELKVVAADSDVAAGKKPTSSLIDELWLFGKKKGAHGLMSEILGARASRPEGFTMSLTTQSDEEPAGIFKEKLAYHRGVRDGTIHDPSAFQMLFEFPRAMEEEEEWRDISNVYITNPSLGRVVHPKFFIDGLKRAQLEGEQSLRIFAAKHLNVEIGVGLKSNRWPGVESWAKSEDPDLTFESLVDRSDVVVIGIDGGGRDDLYGFCALGREKITRRWLAWGHAWCQRGVLARRPGIETRLLDFEKAGELTIIEDDDMTEVEINDGEDTILVPTDIYQICQKVEYVKEKNKLGCVAADPAGVLGETQDELDRIGVREDNNLLVGVPQGIGLMNAIKTTDRRAANGTFVHNKSSLFTWCVGNLKIEAMATAIRATKQYAGDAKIDTAMAMFDAAVVMMLDPKPNGLPQILIIG